jgi:tetratricopeptide (TPR) repeat protein
MEQGELVEADVFLKQALQAFQEIGDRRNVAMMLNNTGYLRWNQGRFEEAESYILQSLDIRTEIEDRVGVGRNYGFLAGLYTASGDLEKAKMAAKQAAEVARETSDRLFEGTSQSQLGDIAKAMGDYSKARDYYLKGRVIFQDINDRMRALQSDLKLVSLDIAVGSYSQAGQTASEVMLEAREQGLIMPEIEAMELLGDLALAQGDPGLASREFARALDRVRESSWSGKESDLMIKQVDVLLDQLDLDAASPLIGALSRQEESANSLEVQARFSYQTGDFQSAVVHMEKARTLAGEGWTEEQELKLKVYKEKADAVG